MFDAMVDLQVDADAGRDTVHPGVYNYVFTRLMHKSLVTVFNYEHLNAMIGMLECCKAELYRKVAAPYEDKKIAQNGSVSVLDARSLEDVR
jgi:hypothetical protein